MFGSPLFRSILVGLICIFFTVKSAAQTDKDVQKITATYDRAYLQNLAAQSLKKSIAEKKEAIEYARSRNIPVAYVAKDSSYNELQKVLPDGTLIYYQTHNKEAAHSTRTDLINSGGTMALNLDGQNMKTYVWDGGHPLIAHQEFIEAAGSSRVSIMDSSAENGIFLNWHATHVMGTIAASGIDANAKGMAPQSKVEAYKWNSDLAEATSAVLQGMLLSNHSYGYDSGSLTYNLFGAYIERSRDWDNLMFHAPYFLMVASAGNDGQNDEVNGNPLLQGYDKLSGFKVSKNNLVIASAKNAVIDANGDFVSAEISTSSSQGPTDDLRIKPDLAGIGVGVYSTDVVSVTAYKTASGTSMATPNITGSLLLLQQHFNNLNGNFMRAATLKGLALHTADQFDGVGPNAVSGWGLLNAKKAAETIIQNGSETLVQELVIAQGQTISFTVDSDEINKLMASISWTDPAGRANSGLNSEIAVLVNDLDVKIEGGNTVFYPWRLTSVTLNSNNSDNVKDPFERVDIANASGTYTITVTHKGTLVGGSQAFSLIVTGIKSMDCSTASVPEDIQPVHITGTRAAFVWNVIPRSFYGLRYRKEHTEEWMEVQDFDQNYYEMQNLEPLTTYELQIGSRCSVEDTFNFSDYSFSTGEISYCDSFAEDEETPFFISNIILNTIDNTSEHTVYSDFTSLGTELVEGNTYEISITGTADLNYRTSYAVWIDYNKDGYFDGAEERVFSATTVANTPTIGSFTVPMGIGEISTRMRVSLTADSLPTRPCDTFVNGEVEDYTINLRPAIDFVYENEIWSPIHPAGNCTKMDNIQVINGIATLETDISVKNILIDEEAKLNVEKILTLAGDLSINGNLVFVSTANGNGELGVVPETSAITGNATVQSYMSSKRAYRIVSSSVNTIASIHANWQEGATSNVDDPDPGFGTHITGTLVDQENGFDATATGNPSMYYVSVEAQEYTAIENTDVNTLAAGDAYLLYVRGDRSIDLSDNSSHGATTLRATGSLVHGPQTQSFASVAEDFVMFGNPYQSAVDITSVFANSTNLNTNHYYLYDPQNATHGNFITIDLFEPSPYQFLQPGQAAQVEVTGPATIRFNEVDKAPGNFTALHRPTILGRDKLLVDLFTTENYSNGGPLHDSFVIRFGDGNDNALTPLDAVKPMNFYENIAVDYNGTYLSSERREMPIASEIFSMYIGGYQYTTYTMSITVDGLAEIVFYLDDSFTGGSTLLEEGTNIYTFEIDAAVSATTVTDRFSIRTGARLNVANNDVFMGVHLYPNPLKENGFNIFAPNLLHKQVSVGITDLMGRRIFENSYHFATKTINIPIEKNLASGIYLITLKTGKDSGTYKLIKE